MSVTNIMAWLIQFQFMEDQSEARNHHPVGQQRTKENFMNKFNSIADGATQHSTWLPQVCNPAYLQQLTSLGHKSLMWLSMLLLAAFVAGCGGSDGVADTTAPIVSSTSPANAATSVPLSSNIAVGFSEAMDAPTITDTTFTLKQGATPIAGAVSYAGTTATFNPNASLVAGLVYTATVTTGVKDLAGNVMLATKTWTFTTTADITPPTVNSTSPADTATGVALNANVTATFSKAMDPLTITTTTFTLAQGATPITGVVTSPSSTTTTFNPAADLTASTVYTATLSTGVKDLAGNALTVAKVWSFTTGAAAVAGVAPVDLGTAANYAILTKTGVSTTGVTAVTGNVGASPIARVGLTGWALISEPTDASFTSALVVTPFKLYAADNVGGTTSVDLTTAVGDMQTAYTDAAGRAGGGCPGSGDLSGLTLAPGVYTCAVNVLINTNVTLAGTGVATDVWIFQITGKLTQASNVQVLLTNGALAQNVFWQVSDVVEIGTTAQMRGVILAKTGINLRTGASINGRLLAQTAVTLQETTVTQP